MAKKFPPLQAPIAAPKGREDHPAPGDEHLQVTRPWARFFQQVGDGIGGGEPGPAGPAGPAGPKGDKGDKGDTGDVNLIPEHEDPAGSIDGINRIFALSYLPDPRYPEWVVLELNGVVQQIDVEYSISGHLITYAQAPKDGDRHHAYYFRGPVPPAMTSAVLYLTTAHASDGVVADSDGTTPVKPAAAVSLWDIRDYGGHTGELYNLNVGYLGFGHNDAINDGDSWPKRTDEFELLPSGESWPNYGADGFGDYAYSVSSVLALLRSLSVTCYNWQSLPCSGGPSTFDVYDCHLVITYANGSTQTFRPGRALALPAGDPDYGGWTDTGKSCDNDEALLTYARDSAIAFGGLGNGWTPGFLVLDAWVSAGADASAEERGNISYEQIREAHRQGAGAKLQTFAGGSTSAGHAAVFDASGAVVDGGSAPVGIADVVSVAGITIDGGASPPATGSKGFLAIPFAGTITGWKLIANVSGSAQITVKKCSDAGFPATASIVAAAPPALSSAQKNSDTTLTGWTTGISAGDILEFILDSVTTCTWLSLELEITRS